MGCRWLMMIGLLIWVNSCASGPRDEVFRSVAAWSPDEIDGEGFDHGSEMVRDLNLERRRNALVIGDIGRERLTEGYRRTFRLEDGSFQSEDGESRVRFRLHPKLAERIKGSADWLDGASFGAICVCVRKRDGGLPECVAIQFEGGPFYKVMDPVWKGRYGLEP